MNNIDSIAMNNEIPEPEVCTKRSRPPALTVKQLLHCRLMKLMQTQGLWNERLAADIPSSWEKFDNFVVFSNKCFKDADWSKAGPQLWKVVADVFSVENVALKGRIENDLYRSPRMEIVYGNSNLVQFKDNGIRYTWSATSCMFSRGNVTERHRVGCMDCRGEVVVDLFAGIGYFTLPFLVKAHCEHLHACEWNRNAVECLKHNLKLNKVDKKCTIHEGDNRNVCPQNIADRVNLGLIPTSRDSWRTACLALKSQTGGVLHVHENLNTKLTNSLCPCQCPTHVCQAFKCDKCVQLLKLSCIKCVDEFPIDLMFKLTIKHNELFHNQSESGDKSELDQKSNEIVTHHVSRQNSTVELVSMDETLYLTLVKDKLSWKNYEFMIWALHTCHSFTQIFYEIYKQPWSVSVKNIHHVKSYAPHIEHMVLDLDCRPSNEEHSEIRSSKY